MWTQLNLFEVPHIPPGDSAPWRAQVPFSIEHPYNAEKWFKELLRTRRPLIFLKGKNPGICHASCLQSWEGRCPDLVRRTWINRDFAMSLLSKNGYSRHGTVRQGYGPKSNYFEVFYRAMPRENKC